MTFSVIPTCYFPSTVAFIDDSRDFLMNFTLQLDESLAYRLFQSPYDALDAVYTVQPTLDQLNQRCVSEYIESHDWPLTHQTVSLDLAAIHWEVYNAQRFSEISVVVVDYAMPGMNGLEFCKRLGASPIRKILLTGQADEKTAIKAFNEGLIHCYIKKNDPDVTTLIHESIYRLQRQYFQNMSEMITRMLAVNSPNCLQDAAFSKLFHQICEDNHIVEFYLMENSGSFMLLDKHAQMSCLIVKNDQDLKMYYDLARDNKAPEDVLSDLRSGNKIPFYAQFGEHHQTWSDWSNYLYPAEKIQGQETYYYALIKGALPFDVNQDKIVSYHDYLESLDVATVKEAQGDLVV
jgi:CheY-like chemotaxis protein